MGPIHRQQEGGGEGRRALLYLLLKCTRHGGDKGSFLRALVREFDVVSLDDRTDFDCLIHEYLAYVRGIRSSFFVHISGSY